MLLISLMNYMLIIIECEIHPFCLNVASTWVTCRYPGLAADVSWVSRASS